MRGVFINCPACNKMLFKNTYLRVGSYITTKCFHCGEVIEVRAELGNIRLSRPNAKLSTENNANSLTDDEDNDTMFLEI